jgi:hypothetical protein
MMGKSNYLTMRIKIKKNINGISCIQTTFFFFYEILDKLQNIIIFLLHIPYVFGKFSPNFEKKNKSITFCHISTHVFGLVAFSKAVFDCFFTRR